MKKRRMCPVHLSSLGHDCDTASVVGYDCDTFHFWFMKKKHVAYHYLRMNRPTICVKDHDMMAEW